MFSEYTIHNTLDKVALRRAQKVIGHDSHPLVWFKIFLSQALLFFVAAFFFHGGINSFLLIGMILVYASLLHLERAGFIRLVEQTRQRAEKE